MPVVTSTRHVSATSRGAESAPTRINFCHRLFVGPVEASAWVPPSGPGLYAILVKDQLCHPRPFRPIFFGQTGNYAERNFLEGHRKYWEWRAVADAELFVATCPMPFSSDAARAAAESELVRHYQPECNA
jgi:hypothetical protein